MDAASSEEPIARSRIPAAFLTIFLIYVAFFVSPVSYRYDGPNGLAIGVLFWTGLPLLALIAAVIATLLTPRRPLNALDRFAPSVTVSIVVSMLLFAVMGLGLIPT
jgi:hypothetical protein